MFIFCHRDDWKTNHAHAHLDATLDQNENGRLKLENGSDVYFQVSFDWFVKKKWNSVCVADERQLICSCILIIQGWVQSQMTDIAIIQIFELKFIPQFSTPAFNRPICKSEKKTLGLLSFEQRHRVKNDYIESSIQQPSFSRSKIVNMCESGQLP